MPDAASLIPVVTDEDIEWVRDLMKLDALDHPRREFLIKHTTLDVSACPGSGKTTLVVAKLAILARKWPHRTKGICVLSHTNVARERIQSLLGGTVIGQRLLGYPHFIETIHGFTNRFLALPWLGSNGFPPPTIDDDVTTAYRRGVLAIAEYWTVQNCLLNKSQKQRGFEHLRIRDRGFNFNFGRKAFPAGPDAKSFKFAKRAIETAAQAGYFCYDEMFVWAHALLNDCPDVASWLRHRFPLVIIDEMQDTSQIQGSLLHAVFPRASTEIVVQRVGDPNQAIFDEDAEAAQDDPFPDADGARCLAIPNSYRFGPEIAGLASPFAIKKVGTDGLLGLGPKGTTGLPTRCPHTIFIFPANNTEGVLDAYGKHLLAIFDDDALGKGEVTAVGGVHKGASDVEPGHPHFPKTVPHYWSGYIAGQSRKAPHPKTLVQFIRAAVGMVQNGKDLSPGVEQIALGLIRLADLTGDTGTLKRRRRSHQAIIERLTSTQLDEDNKGTIALEKYRHLLRAYLIERKPMLEPKWPRIQAYVLSIANALCDGNTDSRRASDFLAWSEGPSLPNDTQQGGAADVPPNAYRYKEGGDGRRVDIRLGSIHAVKGEDHLATMLLSTYFHEHSSLRILPWLLGTKANLSGAGPQDRRRLLQTYVAMTRPTHLLCLAIPRFVLGDSREYADALRAFYKQGWHVIDVGDATRPKSREK